MSVAPESNQPVGWHVQSPRWQGDTTVKDKLHAVHKASGWATLPT